MKKLLTAILALLALAAFPGLSAAQNEKAGEKQTAGKTTLAIPPADNVTLWATNNIASTKGCPVTAKPGLTSNPAAIFAHYSYVNFERFVSGHWVALTPNSAMVTNSAGVAQRTIPWSTKIRAWIYKVQANPAKAVSNEFTCEKYPSQ